MTSFVSSRHAEWERHFESAVDLAVHGKTTASLAKVARLRRWQRRQPLNGLDNHSWHDAELLWLEGVLLERSRQARKARLVWTRVARLLAAAIRAGETWFLPRCETCARRPAVLAPQWLGTARRLKRLRGADETILVEALVTEARRRVA